MRHCESRRGTMLPGALSAGCLPGTVVGTGDSPAGRTDKVFTLMEFTFQEKGRQTMNN